ncbi:hypothetical protein V2G26_009772 [Clonostachys chloroleuca]
MAKATLTENTICTKREACSHPSQSTPNWRVIPHTSSSVVFCCRLSHAPPRLSIGATHWVWLNHSGVRGLRAGPHPFLTTFCIVPGEQPYLPTQAARHPLSGYVCRKTYACLNDHGRDFQVHRPGERGKSLPFTPEQLSLNNSKSTQHPGPHTTAHV